MTKIAAAILLAGLLIYFGLRSIANAIIDKNN